MQNTQFPVLLSGMIEPVPPISFAMDGATHRLVFRGSFIRLRAESATVLEDLKTACDGKTMVLVVGRYERVESLYLLVHQVAKILVPERKHAMLQRSESPDGVDAWPWKAFSMKTIDGGDGFFPLSPRS